MTDTKNTTDELDFSEKPEYLCLQVDSEDNSVLHRSIPLTLQQAQESAKSANVKSIIVKIVEHINPQLLERNISLATQLKSQAERLLTGEVDISTRYATQDLLTATNIVGSLISLGLKKAKSAKY